MKNIFTDYYKALYEKKQNVKFKILDLIRRKRIYFSY